MRRVTTSHNGHKGSQGPSGVHMEPSQAVTKAPTDRGRFLLGFDLPTEYTPTNVSMRNIFSKHFCVFKIFNLEEFATLRELVAC